MKQFIYNTLTMLSCMNMHVTLRKYALHRRGFWYPSRPELWMNHRSDTTFFDYCQRRYSVPYVRAIHAGQAVGISESDGDVQGPKQGQMKG